MKVTLLNTSIITDYGVFEYSKASLSDIKKLIKNGFESAIGHDQTASIISKLLGVEVKVNRVNYTQNIGDIALIFKLKKRGEEGKIYSEKEIEEMGYSWGIIKKLK